MLIIHCWLRTRRFGTKSRRHAFKTIYVPCSGGSSTIASLARRTISERSVSRRIHSLALPGLVKQRPCSHCNRCRSTIYARARKCALVIVKTDCFGLRAKQYWATRIAADSCAHDVIVHAIHPSHFCKQCLELLHRNTPLSLCDDLGKS